MYQNIMFIFDFGVIFREVDWEVRAKMAIL